MFLWPDIFSWSPFQIILWNFYQYEAIVTQYIRLVIQAIQSSCVRQKPPKIVFQKWVFKRSNHYAYLGGHYFIISFWLTPLPVLLIRSIQQRDKMDLIATRVDYVLEFSSWLFHLSLVVGLITRRSIPFIKYPPGLIEANNGFVLSGVLP